MSVDDDLKYCCCYSQTNFMNGLIFERSAFDMIVTLSSYNSEETATDNNEIALCS